MTARRITAAAFAPGAIAAAFWMSAVLAGTRLVDVDRHVAEGDGFDLPGRALGLMRGAVGARFFERADLYFHRGIPHGRESIGPTIYDRWAARLTPRVPLHAEGAEACEILPWLRLATTLSPSNVDAYLVAAYWMDRNAGRPDLAEGILREAVRRNPGDYRPFFDWARIAVRRGAVARALGLLGAGLRAWPSPLDAGDEGAVRDRALLLEMRGLLLAATGKRDEALAELQRAAELRPGAEASIRARMEDIRSGESGGVYVPAFLKQTAPRATCEHDHGDGPDNGHESGHEHGHEDAHSPDRASVVPDRAPPAPPDAGGGPR